MYDMYGNDLRTVDSFGNRRIVIGSPEANELAERDKRYRYRIDNAGILIDEVKDELSALEDDIAEIDKKIRALQAERADLVEDSGRLKVELADLERIVEDEPPDEE
jgi:chromosome segregation ATPase